MSAEGETEGRKAGLWRPAGVLLIVVAVVILYKVFGSQIQRLLETAKTWIESTGVWAPVVFVAVYIVAVVACFSGAVLTIGGGVMFGPVLGVILVSIASTTGATCSFLIARYLARKQIARWLEGKEKFQRLDRLTAEHGGMVVAIARLIPLFPFTLINYGFGLTEVRFLTYVVCSWLFMLPGTAAFVLIGATGGQAAEEGRFPWAVFLVLLAVVVVLFVLGRFARSYLKRKMAAASGEAGEVP